MTPNHLRYIAEETAFPVNDEQNGTGRAGLTTVLYLMAHAPERPEEYLPEHGEQPPSDYHIPPTDATLKYWRARRMNAILSWPRYWALEQIKRSTLPVTEEEAA